MPRALNPLPTGTQALLRHGAEAVAYHIPIAPPSDSESPYKSTIALPRRSAWTSGLHLHATHTEYLHLVSGAVFVELNGETKFFSALEGGEVDRSTGKLIRKGLVVEVPRFARHNWGRLDHHSASNRPLGQAGGRKWALPEDWADEAVVEEWTDPIDTGKPLFFWNLNRIITAPVPTAPPLSRKVIARRFLGGCWTDLQLFIVFWELDNWPIFLDLRKKLRLEKPHKLLTMLTDGVEVLITFLALFFARIVGSILGLRAVEKGRTPDALWEEYRKPPRSL